MEPGRPSVSEMVARVDQAEARQRQQLQQQRRPRGAAGKAARPRGRGKLCWLVLVVVGLLAIAGFGIATVMEVCRCVFVSSCPVFSTSVFSRFSLFGAPLFHSGYLFFLFLDTEVRGSCALEAEIVRQRNHPPPPLPSWQRSFTVDIYSQLFSRNIFMGRRAVSKLNIS